MLVNPEDQSLLAIVRQPVGADGGFQHPAIDTAVGAVERIAVAQHLDAGGRRFGQAFARHVQRDRGSRIREANGFVNNVRAQHLPVHFPGVAPDDIIESLRIVREALVAARLRLAPHAAQLRRIDKEIHLRAMFHVRPIGEPQLLRALIVRWEYAVDQPARVDLPGFDVMDVTIQSRASNRCLVADRDALVDITRTRDHAEYIDHRRGPASDVHELRRAIAHFLGGIRWLERIGFGRDVRNGCIARGRGARIELDQFCRRQLLERLPLLFAFVDAGAEAARGSQQQHQGAAAERKQTATGGRRDR